MADSLDCFFVTPIGGLESQERKRADNLLQYVLRPSIGATHSILRADEIEHPGSITADIVRHLCTTDLVVADLTSQNPNVMYEIGIRHSFNLPIIQIAQTGERLPFDIAFERTIFFDLHDLKSVEGAKQKISAAAKHVVDKKKYISPVARILQDEEIALRAQDAVETRGILNMLSGIQDSIADLSMDLSQIELAIDSVELNQTATIDRELLDRLTEMSRFLDQVSSTDIRELLNHLRKPR
jgi:hypothetical protein